MARVKKTAMGKKMERAAILTGKELGALVGRLEREARDMARKRTEMGDAARKRSVEAMRRAARALEKLANQVEKAGKRAR